jgi:DNA-binding CsgD family transcriptional regulator
MTVIELSRARSFPPHGQPRQARELVGRDRELTVIEALVDQLPARDGALLLTGEPGVGKSALLDAADEKAEAADIRVLRAAGTESEDVSFFGLNQLLLPLRDDLGLLDQPQREVLNVALGFRDGPAPGRLVVSNAALTLLQQAAADRPLLLIADDLQWMDQASALVLGFIARRLRGSWIGLIAAERAGSARFPVLDGPGHEVRPLDDETAARLVTARFPGLAPAVRRRVVTEARGIPLALLELPGEFSEQHAPVPALLPLSGPPREAGDAGQARRLAAAAYRAASVAGDLNAAETLLAGARQASPGPEPSAEIALATAFVLLHGDGDVTAAYPLLLPALETAPGAGLSDPGEALETLLTLCRVSGRAEHWQSLERLVTRPRSPVLDGEARSLGAAADPAQVVRLASAAAFAGYLPDCRPALRRVAGSEPGGSEGPLALQASILLALEAYQTGQWDEAWRLAARAVGQCASRGYPLLRYQAQTVQALVAACRGDIATARALADEITRWAAPRELTSLLAGAHYAAALTALAQADFPAAYAHAARISPAGTIPARQPFAAWALLDLVEAALRTGRPGDASAHVRAAARAGLAGASPRAALLTAAATAMTAPDDDAQALFDLALAGEDSGRWPFDRARVHLLAGERLRRLRAVGTARAHLGTAQEEFRRLGAATWADRAATALRATGQVPPRGDSGDREVLTPQELEIARLAAAGLSNREIGVRLFVSHRTVASHLYRMFPKLGITSRAALGRALLPDHG